jgi:hypothetical protein
VPTTAKATQLVANIRRFLTGVGAPASLHGPSKIGSSMSPAANDPLVTEWDNHGQMADNNAVFVGGSWYAINGTLTWALSSLDGRVPNAREYAWDELLRNTLAYHANAFPDHWDGIITVDDVCWSWYSSHPERCGPGMSWAEGWRGQIAHQPAWLWFDLLKMAGIDATVKGYVIDPRLPLPHYTLRMPNFGIRVSQASVDGYCRTESAEAFEIKLKLVAGNQPTTAWVDGASVAHEVEAGYVVLKVPAGDAHTLRHWGIALGGEVKPDPREFPLMP